MRSKAGSAMTKVIVALLLAVAGVYLFVTAPPPLPDGTQSSACVPAEEVLAVLAAEGARVRELYTREIVGRGTAAGIRFDERWRERGLDAAPIPSLFLREIAAFVEGQGLGVSFFLGSDHPINEANRLRGAQAEAFARMKASLRPEVFRAPDTGLVTAMYPDLAIADACARCHNEHRASPKRDWQNGDLMGATTWMSSEACVPHARVAAMISALRGGFAHAYRRVLAKAATFERPPPVGALWPREGYLLPSVEEFMREVRRQTSEPTLDSILTLSSGAGPWPSAGARASR